MDALTRKKRQLEKLKVELAELEEKKAKLGKKKK